MPWDIVFIATLVVLTALFGLWRLKRLVLGESRLPYVGRETLHSPIEQAFHASLIQAVERKAMIACKVRIADVLAVRFRQRHARDQRWWRYFRLISSKHVDFVLCEPCGGRILVAIELDDRSHRRVDRRRRDRFVDRAFASANVPLVRVSTRGRFDAREIHARLAPYLTTSEEGPVA